MNACGIIVEYNPFHKGHELHIKKAKEKSKCDVLIAVMSGNFTQRGEPAVINKFERAKTAILNGVDLVLELPYIYCIQSASKFAYGAVKVLNMANVNSICFGSESNNLKELKEIAKTNINIDYLKESMNSGNSFAKSYGLLCKEMQPNDILAVSYLKEIFKTKIKPISIQRTNHYHDLTLNKISSASAIRNALFKNIDIEDTTVMKDVLLSNKLIKLDDYFLQIKLLLLTLDKKYLSNIFLFSEGIENHLIKKIIKHDNLEQFLDDACNRRYTKSRIRRCLIHLLNQVTYDDVNKLEDLNTIRVLAMNNKGRQYLKTLKDVNIASRFSKIQDGYREMEYKVCMSYSSILNKKDQQNLINQEIGGLIYINI